MPNRLADETSPYLLQHANNPVDWYPWGTEALTRAKVESKPILLSIGYAACHWCHVMEHESFENASIAALMNQHFINIKVDREERPDIDSIYMQAVQAMTGHGGWPMTMFLTPAGEPFYAGTYFPPTDRHGMPGFPRVLASLAQAWTNDREKIHETGARVREIYAPRAATSDTAPDARTLERAYRAMARQFDEAHAGFGGAPKFPPSMGCDFLLRYWARTESPLALDMAHRTFVAMSRGGIYDQVGGGIHRYSVDDHWLVPHFEKMLYDNALFLRLGVHLWQATGDEEVRRATTATLRWVRREMTSPEGGFYSSLDADSEGHEGKFYVWDVSELDAVLGDDTTLVKAAWGVTPDGNFEGRNILTQVDSLEAIDARHSVPPGSTAVALDRARTALYARRAARIWPGLDDKVLASWNGLMLRAVIEYARVFGDAEARALALRNAAFLSEHLVSDGRVRRSWRQNKVLDVGFLEDHAAVGLAFLDLFSLTGEVIWLEKTRAITAHLVNMFRDPDTGLVFDTASDHETLITRPRDVTDNAMPSGQSLAAELLARLAVVDERAEYGEMAEALLASVSDALGQYPSAFGHLLGTADQLIHGAIEVAMVGEGPESELMRAFSGIYVPSVVFATDGGHSALTRGKTRAQAFVCRRYLCDAPTSDPAVLRTQLLSARRAR